MNNLSMRQKQIFQMLINTKDYISSQEIANKLNVSVRTIKTDIAEIKYYIKNNPSCSFCSCPSKGYKMICINDEGFADIFDTSSYFMSSNKYLEDDTRQACLFMDILNSRGIIAIKEITEKYYITRATVYNDLERLNKQLLNYDVQIKYIPYQGIYLEGKELNIRFAVQNELLVNEILSENIVKNNCLEFSKDNLLSFINSFSINCISDFELSNLYYHLLTIIIRCKNHSYILKDDLCYELFVNESEIKKLYEYLEQYKPEALIIPREEAIYFILLMKGCNLGFCNQSALELTNRCIKLLENKLKIYLSSQNRISSLATYIYSMLIRNYNHFIQNDILLDDIIEKHSLSFDIALHFACIIEKILKMKIDKSEITHFAYFFLDIRDSLRKYYNPNRILLASFRGSIMCHHLLDELQTNFSFYQFDVCELYEVEQKISQQEYSFVVTDVAIHTRERIPIVLISHFMNSNDYKIIRKQLRMIYHHLIDHYLNNIKIIDVLDKDGFLKHISSSIDEYYMLIEREKRFTFQVQDTVIIYVYNLKFKSSIYYCQNGILWNNKYIYYIFVINITEYNHLFNYSKIISIYLDKINELYK